MRLSSAQVGAIAAFAIVGGAVTLSHRVTRAAAADDHMVTQEQFDKWKTELSNWGRWGKDDQKGTMNLITPAKRKSAASTASSLTNPQNFRVSGGRRSRYRPMPQRHRAPRP